MQGFSEAAEFIKGRLSSELPPSLHYHSLRHALDVESAARLLCGMEGIEARRKGLVSLAALWHDAGFLVRLSDNETCACEIARKHLPSFGLVSDDIEDICSMIMSTRIPQSPKTLEEMILCDADLSSVGSADAMLKASLLRREMHSLGHPFSDGEWRNFQLAFLSGHSYFTESARKLWDSAKLQMLSDLQASHS